MIKHTAEDPIELKTIDDMLALVTTHVSVHFVVIHPEVATRLLEANQFNRSMNERRVKFHVTNLEEGRWQVLTDCVGIDTNGDLTNGQHRLRAIMLSGQPAPVGLFFGLDPRARLVTDTGRARTTADTLGALGHGRGMTHVVAAAKLMRWYSSGQQIADRRDAVPHDKIIEYITDVVGVDRLKSADVVAKRFVVNVPGARRSAVMAFILLAHDAGIADYMIEQFIESTTTGADLAVSDPRLSLRSVLTKLTENRTNFWHLAVIIKAFNAWRRHRPLGIVKWSETESFPVIVR